jgi:hypothetical protein
MGVNQQITDKVPSQAVNQIIAMDDERADIKRRLGPHNSSYLSNHSYHSNNSCHSNYSYHSNGVNNNINCLNLSNQSLRNPILAQ